MYTRQPNKRWHSCIARDRERQRETDPKHWGVSTRARDSHTVLTRRTHPSHPSTSTAPSQPAVWPCQMTYDTQHLRSIRGGALSNAHTHTEGGGSSKHTNGIAACIARDRETDPKHWGVSTRAKDLRSVLTRDAHTPIPPIQQHSTEPASRVAVSDDI